MSGSYRDRVTIKQDARASGSQAPSFTSTLAEDVPCAITMTRGDETYRGRQLESNVDFVVEMRYSSTLGNISETDQITINSGLFSGKTLNVKWPRVHQYQKGKPPIIEVFCRENNSN